MIDRQLWEKLGVITPEEQELLDGREGIDRALYTDSGGAQVVVDSKKLLGAGKLIQIRPHTRFVHFPPHRHNYIELIYMCSGATTHLINGDEVELREGELLFLSRSATQEIFPAQKDDIAVNFIILPEFFDTALRMLGDTDNLLSEFVIGCLREKDSGVGYLHFRVADVLPVQNLVENLIWTLMNDQGAKRSVNQITMGLLFIQLLQHTKRVSIGRQSPERELLLRVLRYAEENYRDGELRALADELGYELCTLSRLIKRISGRSFTELMQAKRLSQACWLLDNTGLCVEEVSLRVGYENKSYFSRIFKQRFGVSPGEYRK